MPSFLLSPPAPLSLLRPSLGALPQKNIPRVSSVCPLTRWSPLLWAPTEPPWSLQGAWSYLRPELIFSSPEGGSSRKGLGLTPLSLCLQGPQSYTEQALPSAGWKGALSPTYPSIISI